MNNELKFQNKLKDLQIFFHSSEEAGEEEKLNKVLDSKKICMELKSFSNLAFKVFLLVFFYDISYFRVAVGLRVSEKFVRNIYKKSVIRVWLASVDYHQGA